ncbi:manganese/zinc/iron transport system substrate-binding protein [Ekhidna lutea]|uniref:Manganese/zinc/iron transport system substrate-binding protein n=1 Tax=Ekhidna lutea TaxID=447679 RepID=A0A239H6I4_EKHLU|nr:zinc ABC transporter substrate-binding protein [Ekhidna lutea]SNS76781.1 manganese/zinc/iron transport system substrate-binding protein [Ekhidna lutea]
MKNLFFIFIALITLGCTTAEKSGDGNEKPHIVATTGMLYDAVINIAGDKVTAEAIMGPGVDPHLYKATQGDLAKFNKADLIVYNGIYLEGKMSDILAKLGRQKPVVAAAESIPKEMLKSAIGYDDAYDPHVWFDVQRWRYVVTSINEALIKLDSTNREYFQTNAASYLKELDSLDRYVKQRINEIPEDQRILVTAHDAFVYFGDAYGMQVEGLQGISTVADFGLKDIAEVIDLIIENNIKAIFVETSVSDKSIKAVVTGCQEKGHEVKIGGYLYSDAMGELGTEEGTYTGMFKSNVETIVNALK